MAQAEETVSHSSHHESSSVFEKAGLERALQQPSHKQKVMRLQHFNAVNLRSVIKPMLFSVRCKCVINTRIVGPFVAVLQRFTRLYMKNELV